MQLPPMLIMIVIICNLIILEEWIRRINNLSRYHLSHQTLRFPHQLFQMKTLTQIMLTRSYTPFHHPHTTLIIIVRTMTMNLICFHQVQENLQKESSQASKGKVKRGYNEFAYLMTRTITCDRRIGKSTHIGYNTDTKVQFGIRLEEICRTWRNNCVEKSHTTSWHEKFHTNQWKIMTKK